MRCENHPNVEGIDRCIKCDAPLCGQCAHFLEEGVFCEECAKDWERKQFVDGQTRQFEKPEPELVERASEEKSEQVALPGDRGSKLFQYLIITFAAIFVPVQFYLYMNQSPEVIDAEATVLHNEFVSFLDCLTIFREIGELLNAGEELPDSLVCEPPGTPNIVSTVNGATRITHPAPDLYSFGEIYITSGTSEPVLVPLLNNDN